jgi:AraC-like DNA-binding protein
MLQPVPIRTWRATECGGLDLLHGTFTNHAFRPHTHETYSIGILERGAMTFACRGSMFTQRPGLIGLINPDEAHTGHAANNEGWTYRSFLPDVALLRGVFTDLENGSTSLPRLPNVIDDAPLAQAFALAHQSFEQPASSLARESLMRDALGKLLVRHAIRAPVKELARAPLGQVRALLEEDFTRNVTLDELAQLAGLNAFTLLRAFRKTFGLPPHAYQLQVRLRHAKRLLRQGETPARAALETGFADQSHFGRHFRRAFGITPQQYRLGASKTF